ncbi:serpin B8-like [Schistocerca americana]|uniref:serpin B8-like n=1 Tax=Schistocerca americana TaxID=7009 RepID=UPI001F4F7759|nr:serpin B8-like [Schistocerca americana]
MPDGDFSDALQTVSRANDLFTADMFRVLAEEQGNLFFSPWSIQVILALAFLGAGGNTAKQMARGLRLPEDKNATEEGFSEILQQLKESDDVILRVANRIFVKQNFTIKERFKQSAKKFMGAVEEMDFRDPGAAGVINSLVSEITNGRINQVIGQEIKQEVDNNKTYWDEKIDNILLQVQAVNTQVGDLSNRVGSVEEKIGSVEAKVNEIDAKLSDEINTVKNELLADRERNVIDFNEIKWEIKNLDENTKVLVKNVEQKN